jgi:hypothetical protein
MSSSRLLKDVGLIEGAFIGVNGIDPLNLLCKACNSYYLVRDCSPIHLSVYLA